LWCKDELPPEVFAFNFFVVPFLDYGIEAAAQQVGDLGTAGDGFGAQAVGFSLGSGLFFFGFGRAAEFDQLVDVERCSG